VQDYEAIINKLANKYYIRSPKFSRDDLVCEGWLAVERAKKKYKPDSGSEAGIFTYAYSAINRQMRDFVQKNKYDIKVPLSEQRRCFLNGTKEELDKQSKASVRLDWDVKTGGSEPVHMRDIIASGTPPIYEELIKNEQSEILMAQVDKLPEKHRMVLTHRFFEDKTLEEVGSTMGFTRERARQIQNEALDKLKVMLRNRLGEDVLL
jgi:RNA polymerase sigma factor (sigma-70 family)